MLAGTMNAARKIAFAVIAVAAVAAAVWLLSRRHAGIHSVSGTIEVDEVHVASRYGGRVIAIPAREGDLLTNGQLIAELDATELLARRDRAAAQLNLASDEERRVTELFRQRVASDQERDTAVNRARVELAQLAEIDAQLREMRITAPGDCVLEVLHVKVGDVAPANREIATLLLPARLWVRVYVPEPWLGRIHVGQEVTVRTDSSREEFTGAIEQINRQAEFTPRNVQTVDDRVRQVFGVKIRLPGDAGKPSPRDAEGSGRQLRAGMSVDVAFPDVPAPPN
jgi:HlyD family secretion protein